MKFSETGGLIFKASEGAGALPVANVIVRIKGSEEENRFVVYSVLTDIDGMTPRLLLPAPKSEYSKTPRSSEAGYSLYDAEISANGYYPKRIYGIPIFPNVDTVQSINMIPLSQNEPYKEYPRGNLNTVIDEYQVLN